MQLKHTIKRERIDGTNGMHSSLKAILDTVGDNAPSQKQIVTIVGTLCILKARARVAGKFCGELGETNRLHIDQLIEQLAQLKPGDKQAWGQLSTRVTATWTTLRHL